MQTILKNRLYVVENFLTDIKCAELVALIDDRATCDIQQYTPNRFQEQYAGHEIAVQMWDKIQSFSSELGVGSCTDTMTIVRYQTDGLATRIHLDGRRTPLEKYGVIIYLNEGFPDGRTVFYNKNMTKLHEVIPRTGLAVFFHMDVRHKGIAPGGEKYILCLRLI